MLNVLKKTNRLEYAEAKVEIENVIHPSPHCHCVVELLAGSSSSRSRHRYQLGDTHFFTNQTEGMRAFMTSPRIILK